MIESRFEQFRLKQERKNQIYKIQIDRFHNKVKDNPELFNTLVKKIKNKYTSLTYFKRSEKLGYSRKSLYTFLLDYSKIYGNTYTEEEYAKYNNLFTLKLYRVHQCYIHLIGTEHYKDILIHI